MSNYTISVDWDGKDALADSSSAKVISGDDFQTEFETVQTAVNSKADLNGSSSVNFAINDATVAGTLAVTGVPTVPTQSAGNSTTRVATTAFVQGEKASPTFTGTPAAPTAAESTNTTQIATTAFVQTAISGVPINVDEDGWILRMNATTEVSDATIDWAHNVKLGSNITESGGVITVGTAGWYYVIFRVFHYGTDANDVDVSVLKGSTAQLSNINWTTNSLDKAGTGFALVDCAADDTISVKGSGKLVGSSDNDSSSYFMGFRLGDT